MTDINTPPPPPENDLETGFNKIILEAGKSLDQMHQQASMFIEKARTEEKKAGSLMPTGDNLARPLVDDLRASLQYDGEKDMVMLLEKQAAVLDNIFRRLLANADTTYHQREQCNINYAQYAAAFKAQDLFCRTARAVNALKNQKKRQKHKTPTQRTDY